MIGWNTSGSSPSYNFLTIPGGGALAGTFTSGGTTTTWVPVIDASGSTLGLVNAASPQSGLATTYTYDPSGTPTASGAANEWPFQYQGREKQFTDPGPYYYSGSGQFYSPQFIRSLSEAGQTSASGPGGGGIGGAGGGGGFSPSGMMIPLPSGSSGGLSAQSLGNDAQQALQVGEDIYNGANYLNQLGLGLSLNNGEYPLAIPLALIGGTIDFLVNFFEDILGGSDNPPTPRKLLHGRHPLYPVILGIQDGLIVDEVSAGPKIGPGSPPSNTPPLQRPDFLQVAFQEPRVVDMPLDQPVPVFNTDGSNDYVLTCRKNGDIEVDDFKLGRHYTRSGSVTVPSMGVRTTYICEGTLAND